MFILPRPHRFPDSNDRSPNNPTVDVSREKILSLYNEHTKAKRKRLTKTVENWFIKTAKEDYSWDVAKFSGTQCSLGVSIPKREITLR